LAQHFNEYLIFDRRCSALQWEQVKWPTVSISRQMRTLLSE